MPGAIDHAEAGNRFVLLAESFEIRRARRGILRAAGWQLRERDEGRANALEYAVELARNEVGQSERLRLDLRLALIVDPNAAVGLHHQRRHDREQDKEVEPSLE